MNFNLMNFNYNLIQQQSFKFNSIKNSINVIQLIQV